MVELINERLDTWNLTISSAIDYFNEIAKSEHALSRCHQKLAASLVQSVAGGTASTGVSPKTEARSSI